MAPPSPTAEEPPHAAEPRFASPSPRPAGPPPAGSDPGTALVARRPGLTPITLFLTLLVAYIAIEVQLVLILLLMALVLATAIERPVQLLERRHLPRPLGILAIYAAIIGGVSLVFVIAAPAIGSEARSLRDQLPGRLDSLEAEWRASANPLLSGPGKDLIAQAGNIVREPEQIDVPEVPGGTALNVVSGVVGGVVGLLTVLVIAFYYLMEKRWLRRLVLDEIVPEQRARVNRIWENVEAKVGDWLRGQLLLCLVIGLLATIGYGVMGIPFWPLLGFWAGLTEIIPVVGPWLGGIPAVVVALTLGLEKTLLVVGFIVVLQMLENTILVPRVMRGAVGLTPLTVFVAILAGTQFRGVVGALLAIPVAAGVQVVLTDYLDVRRAAAQADNGAPLSGWRWMRGPLGGVLMSAAPTATPPPEYGASVPDPEPARPRPDPVVPAPPTPVSPVAGWMDGLGRALKRTEKDESAG